MPSPMDVLPDLAIRPMTVERSRWLGRGLIAASALVAAWWLRRLIRRPLTSLFHPSSSKRIWKKRRHRWSAKECRERTSLRFC